MFIEKLRKSDALEDFLKYYKEQFENESDAVKETLFRSMFDNLREHLQEIEICESPIEKMLVIELNKLKGYLHMKKAETIISRQNVIKVKNKEYRVDIWVKTFLKDGSEIDVIVECDGHNFHEKTKEQAAKDKKRDRDLTSLGFRIMRFTGSEIFEDASGCSFEVMETIESLINLYELNSGSIN